MPGEHPADAHLYHVFRLRVDIDSAPLFSPVSEGPPIRSTVAWLTFLWVGLALMASQHPGGSFNRDENQPPLPQTGWTYPSVHPQQPPQPPSHYQQGYACGPAPGHFSESPRPQPPNFPLPPRAFVSPAPLQGINPSQWGNPQLPQLIHSNPQQVPNTSQWANPQSAQFGGYHDPRYLASYPISQPLAPSQQPPRGNKRPARGNPSTSDSSKRRKKNSQAAPAGTAATASTTTATTSNTTASASSTPNPASQVEIPVAAVVCGVGPSTPLPSTSPSGIGNLSTGKRDPTN